MNHKQKADQGWHQMRTLLDREMPQKHRRRAAGWWWMALLLPLLSAGAGWWMWRSVEMPPETPKKMETAPVLPAPVADASVSKRNMADSRPNPIEVPATVVAIGTVGPKAQTNKKITPAVSAGFRKQPSRDQNEEPASALDPTVQRFSAAEKVSNTTLNLAVENIPMETAGNPAAEREQTGVSETPMAPIPEQLTQPFSLQMLEALPAVALLPSTDKQETFSSGTAFSVKRPATLRQWHWGITARSHHPSLTAVQGFSVGLTANWRFAKRLGLHSGMLYARDYWGINQHALQQVYVAMPALDYYVQGYSGRALQGNIPNTGLVSNDSLVNKVVYMRLRRMQRIEVPIQMFWQPSARLRLYLGGTLHCRLKMEGGYQQTLLPSVLQPLQNVATLNTEAADQLIGESVPRFALRLQVGTGWQITRRIETTVQLQSPFSSLQTGIFNQGNILDDASSLNGSSADKTAFKAGSISGRQALPAFFSVGAVVRLR